MADSSSGSSGPTDCNGGDPTGSPDAAASMITGYRATRGLSAVTVDPRLNKMAADQARAMAAWLQCRSFVFLDAAGRLDVTDIATGVHKLRLMLRRLEDETKARLDLRSAA